jgi:hypothetical protein
MLHQLPDVRSCESGSVSRASTLPDSTGTCARDTRTLSLFIRETRIDPIAGLGVCSCRWSWGVDFAGGCASSTIGYYRTMRLACHFFWCTE